MSAPRPTNAEILARLREFIDAHPATPQPVKSDEQITAESLAEHKAEGRVWERSQASEWDMDRLAERRAS